MKDQQDQDRGRGRARRVRAWMGCVLAGVMLAAGAGCARLEGPLSEDPDVMARQVMAAMGGRRALDKLRYLQFDFVTPTVRRSHLWDKWEGRYRLEKPGAVGRTVVLFDVETREGKVLVGGAQGELFPDPGPEIESAYQNFVNDSYWLLAGLKLRDPGTRRRYAGEMEFGGRMLPTLELWFDGGVGLTPEDRYWFHIDPETHLPVGWSYVLKGREVLPTWVMWAGWQRVGEIRVPTRFLNMDGTEKLRLERVVAPADVADRLFEYASAPPPPEPLPEDQLNAVINSLSDREVRELQEEFERDQRESW